MNRTVLLAASLAFAFSAGAANAQNQCVGKVPELRVIAQASPSVLVTEANLPEFEQKWKTKVTITKFGEQERRAKARLDLSLGAGVYHVIYMEEGNLAEYVKANWLYPIKPLVPTEYDFDDYRKDMSSIATIDGVQYYAPFEGGGDILMYRKDILDAKHIKVPTTFDELEAAIKAVHDPAHGIYGWAMRGERGFGMNVWRWIPLYVMNGGKWLTDDGKPAFAGDIGVKATQQYLDLMKYTPPGGGSASWSDAVEAFRSGQVAFFIEVDVFGPWMEDPSKSNIVGKVGYAPPPAPLPSAGWAHGWAISTVAVKDNDDCLKAVAGDFVGWSTSKEMEQRRLKAGMISDIGRQSTLTSDAYKKAVNPDWLKAVLTTQPETRVLFLRRPEWPQVGDSLGLVLEQLSTGQRADVAGALKEASDQAEDALSN